MLGGVGINPDSAILRQLFVGIQRAKVQRKIQDGFARVDVRSNLDQLD
jgi:hypothetical protein